MAPTSFSARLIGLIACAFSLTLAAASAAQSPQDARLLITVMDSTGGVLADATVTVVGLDAAAKGSVLPPGKTTDKGVFNTSVRPGKYSVQAESPGFEMGLL